MTYSLKDVDDAVALILATRPGTLINRGDYDWSLSIADEAMTGGIILFQPERENQSEIAASPEQIRDILFWMGSQWTMEEISKFARKWPGNDINRIQ